MESAEKARQITAIAEAKQAADIVMLDMSGVSNIADYFVVMTANNARQLNMLADEIMRSLKRIVGKTHGREGSADSGWMLIDYGDVIIHILTQEQRKYYALDELWEKAKAILRIQ
ncbi:MAG: ribosome silencing factor [Chloroflexi bacterium]|nr:ribosome silencing factor [Chloroflexota bacterium]